MTEEIIIDKEDKTKKHRNNEIDCLHFGCRKGESGNVLFWCDFYDDHCDNYTGCYYRKYLRLEQENKELKEKYSHVLELAKTNADSNEYCLQKLEKENKTWQKTCEVLKEQAQLDGECIDKLIEARDMYAKALEEIREYCNSEHGSVYVIIDKINEVLGND